MILAGDVGGTSTRLALFETEETRLELIAECTLSSRNYQTLSYAVREFLSPHDARPTVACLGIAGPVIRGRVETPNLPWVIDTSDMARDLALKTLWLINDLEANAYGVGALDDGDFAVLNAGVLGASGNAGVIAAGTGLGEAGLFWDGHRHRAFACEGGHADFAPRNEREADLLRYLLARFEHVSYERVLSGPGLNNIYQYLRDTSRRTEPAWLLERMRVKGVPEAISIGGLEGSCDLCVAALDIFSSIYGAEAGNLALKLMATGGIYIGGGIAPKIVEKLKSGTFMKAFVAKGRMTPLMLSIPVHVVLNERTALIGAARYAALRATSVEDSLV